MAVPRAVIALAAGLLRPGGRLVMEHADIQRAEALGGDLDHGGWDDVADHDDLAGRPRYVVARRVGTGELAG